MGRWVGFLSFWSAHPRPFPRKVSPAGKITDHVFSILSDWGHDRVISLISQSLIHKNIDLSGGLTQAI